jgi:segregation and condensation protein B
MDLDKKIEAILFWKGEPMKLKKLADMFSVSLDDIKFGINTLKENLEDRGVALIEKEDEVMLATAPEFSSIIEELTKEELSKDLGKASLETLSIVLYQGPIKRSEIDYIRGVNSQFILRNLLVRGLIEKITDPKDARTFVYKPSFELLAHLGVKSIEELPEYESVRTDIESFKMTPQEPELPKEEELSTEEINEEMMNRSDDDTTPIYES